GQLSLPRLADPALLGEFLDVSGALPLRVAPSQGAPRIESEEHDGREHDGGDDELAPASQREGHAGESSGKGSHSVLHLVLLGLVEYEPPLPVVRDRKTTRLNSSHG